MNRAESTLKDARLLAGKQDSASGPAPFGVGNFFNFGGHSIKTPHDHPISHPELALSPTDIGIWTGVLLAHDVCVLESVLCMTTSSTD